MVRPAPSAPQRLRHCGTVATAQTRTRHQQGLRARAPVLLAARGQQHEARGEELVVREQAALARPRRRNVGMHRSVAARARLHHLERGGRARAQRAGEVVLAPGAQRDAERGVCRRHRRVRLHALLRRRHEEHVGGLARAGREPLRVGGGLLAAVGDVGDVAHEGAGGGVVAVEEVGGAVLEGVAQVVGGAAVAERARRGAGHLAEGLEVRDEGKRELRDRDRLRPRHLAQARPRHPPARERLLRLRVDDAAVAALLVGRHERHARRLARRLRREKDHAVRVQRAKVVLRAGAAAAAAEERGGEEGQRADEENAEEREAEDGAAADAVRREPREARHERDVDEEREEDEEAEQAARDVPAHAARRCAVPLARVDFRAVLRGGPAAATRRARSGSVCRTL